MADKHTPDHTRVQVTQNPNFMLSLARGLEVLNAFTPQRQRLTISQLSQKTQISRAAASIRWRRSGWFTVPTVAATNFFPAYWR